MPCFSVVLWFPLFFVLHSFHSLASSTHTHTLPHTHSQEKKQTAGPKNKRVCVSEVKNQVIFLDEPNLLGRWPSLFKQTYGTVQLKKTPSVISGRTGCCCSVFHLLQPYPDKCVHPAAVVNVRVCECWVLMLIRRGVCVCDMTKRVFQLDTFIRCLWCVIPVMQHRQIPQGFTLEGVKHSHVCNPTHTHTYVGKAHSSGLMVNV